MRFSSAFLDAIRSRLPISDVVGRRVSWDKRKSQPQRGDFWACCPFHKEKTPSFHADDRRGTYHCFGCGASGDHFRFLVEADGLSFPEAVKLLAGEAGLPLPVEDKAVVEEEKKRRSLQDVMELAADFFVDCLKNPEGRAAREYLSSRGLSLKLVERFRIGYAPSSRGRIKDYLADKGVSQKDIIETGLLISGDDIPVSYSRFRDRIMFPIEDLSGRVIAFGGRAMSSDQPAKYLNSPETSLFHKGQVLFNAQSARRGSRRSDNLIVVEGYMDVIACVGAGLEATVAPLGTALTEDQLRLLWRMSDEPLLCFDGDSAGEKAAYRAVDMALPLIKPNKSLAFAMLPDGEDPDDILQKGGREALDQKLKRALPLVEMVWRRHTAGQRLNTPERRAGLERTLRSAVSDISDPTVRRHYEASVQERINAVFEGVAETEGKRGLRRSRSERQGEPGANRWRREQRKGPSRSLLASPLMRRVPESASRDIVRPTLQDAILLGAFIKCPGLAEERFEIFTALEFLPGALRSLASLVASLIAEEPDIDGAVLHSTLVRDGFGDQIAEIEKKILSCGLAEFGPDGDIDRLGALWDDAAHLRRRSETLFNKRLAIADMLDEDAGEEGIDQLRQLQLQDDGAAQKSTEESGTELKVTHPFKS